MRYAKILDNGIVDICHCPDNDTELLLSLTNDGYLPIVLTQAPEGKAFYKPQDSFSIVDGKVVQQWHFAVDNDAINARIKELKEQLAKTDYQVIKCKEAKLCGEPMPYDIDAIHAQRNQWRAEINDLENGIIH